MHFSFLSTKNSFSILSRGQKKKKISCFQIGLGLSFELFWPVFFHGLATDLSDLTINNLLKPDLVCVVTAHMVYF